MGVHTYTASQADSFFTAPAFERLSDKNYNTTKEMVVVCAKKSNLKIPDESDKSLEPYLKAYRKRERYLANKRALAGTGNIGGRLRKEVDDLKNCPITSSRTFSRLRPLNGRSL